MYHTSVNKSTEGGFPLVHMWTKKGCVNQRKCSLPVGVEAQQQLAAATRVRGGRGADGKVSSSWVAPMLRACGSRISWCHHARVWRRHCEWRRGIQITAHPPVDWFGGGSTPNRSADHQNKMWASMHVGRIGSPIAASGSTREDRIEVEAEGSCSMGRIIHDRRRRRAGDW